MSGAITTSQTNDLIVMAGTQADVSLTAAAGAGYTMQVVETAVVGGIEDGVAALAGSVGASMSTTSSAQWSGIVIAFKTSPAIAPIPCSLALVGAGGCILHGLDLL